MKTVEDILKHLADVIVGMHRRPQMYVGAMTDPGAANMLDMLLSYSYRSWAYIQERESELSDSQSAVGQRLEFGSRSFSGGYRLLYPNATESALFLLVLQAWTEVGERLGFELREPSPPQ